MEILCESLKPDVESKASKTKQYRFICIILRILSQYIYIYSTTIFSLSIFVSSGFIKRFYAAIFNQPPMHIKIMLLINTWCNRRQGSQTFTKKKFAFRDTILNILISFWPEGHRHPDVQMLRRSTVNAKVIFVGYRAPQGTV